MHLTYRKTCRVCGSRSLTPCINLGFHSLQGSFVTETIKPPVRKVPCELVRCNPELDENACGLLQLAHTVPPEILYSDYWYRSHTNQTMRDHLKGIADTAIDMIKNPQTPAVLDIGCNDATLLSSFPESWIRVGVEPSKVDMFQQFNDKVNVIRDRYPSDKLRQKYPELKFHVISSIAMFYDLEDPVAFAKSVKSQLRDDGLWVIEVSYMPQMLEMNSFDTICHEHLEYYSLSVLETIFKKADLRLLRIQLNSINGGSIRCWVCHRLANFTNDDWDAEIQKARQKEFDLRLDQDAPYIQFNHRIHKVREDLVTLVRRIKGLGQTIHVYGASTKGNTLLQWCDLDSNLISFAADRNPQKHGARTLGTNIPIISEEESRRMRPDWYLVLPWHFKGEFIAREREALQAGIGMIFPLPEVKAIKCDSMS